MKYTTYLFDFDGTLVDSMPVFIDVMLKILDENGISYEKDIVKVITPLGYEGTARYFRRIGLNKDEKELVTLMKDYALEEYKNSIKAKEGVVSTLKILREKGARLNILTASPHLMLDVCLKRLGIFEIFTNVWSCDDFNMTKSNPQIYKEAAEKIGVSVDKILFLDDNYNACKTAKEAGMGVCGVYDESSKEYAEDIKGIVDYYIFRLKELLEL